MHVIYHNRHHSALAESDLSAQYVSFDELVSESDVLSIHANYQPSDSERFNKDIFSSMKTSSIFINTARGSFHNQKDLSEALQSGQIWGAGLDVTNPEPMRSDDSILQLPNICILPHIGSSTKEARNAMAIIAAQNAVDFSKGLRMKTCINPEVYD